MVRNYLLEGGKNCKRASIEKHKGTKLIGKENTETRRVIKEMRDANEIKIKKEIREQRTLSDSRTAIKEL